MNSAKIQSKINKYLKLKYNITPLNEAERKVIKDSKSHLNDTFKPDQIESIINSFYLTVKEIKKVLLPFKENSVGEIYLGSIYRDLYFCFTNAVSTSCMVQINNDSGVKTTFLIKKLDLFLDNISDKVLITDIIDELENTINEIKENFC